METNNLGTATPSPQHQLTLKIEPEYLHAHASGYRTRVVVSSLFNEITTAAVNNQRGKVLVDVRDLEGWLGVFDIYYLVTKDFQRMRGKGIAKVAIIDRPVPKMRDMFFETVSHNRGFNLRIFENPDAALEWLLGQ